VSSDDYRFLGLDAARKALDLIEKTHSPPDARSFNLWQVYAQGENRPLCAAVDDILARKRTLDEADIASLYQAHLGEKSSHDDAQHIAATLMREVQKVLESLDRSTGSASRYDQALNQISSRLDEKLDAGALRQAARQISEVTRNTIAENEAMRANLTSTRAELDAMRQQLDEVQAEALTDGLTRLANRRHFDQHLALLFRDFHAQSGPTALVMMDIDHFKRFNDQHGHQTGDVVLRLAAETMKRNTPVGALAARFGGEELALIVPNCEIFDAIRIAEAIRTQLRGRDLVKRSTGQRLGRVTVSCGVAVTNSQSTASSLIASADKCLYAAKERGRDQTVSQIDLPSAAPVRRAG